LPSPDDGIRGNYFKYPGLTLSVTAPRDGSLHYIPITETAFDSSLPPMLRLADVFAKNENLGGNA
jgi:hypothetical protein